MEKIGNDEKSAWIVVRLILLAVAILFVVYVIFLKQPCDLDAVFLSCRLTGTIGDWLGGMMFFFGLVFMSGIVKGLTGLYNPPQTTKWNWIMFAVMIAGAVIFWNL